MKKFALILMLSLYLLMQKTHAQDFPDIKFSLLSTNNGLPTNSINYVFKDSRGLIWLGTYNKGLLRYDGKKIKGYYTREGIISGYINTICEDLHGRLWMQTLEGLCRFDPFTEKAIFYQHDDKNKNSVASNEKPIPFIDSRGRLWVTSTGGLQQFDEEKNTFINYSAPPISKPEWQAQFNHLGYMLEDDKHRLWVGSAYGLYLVDTTSNTLKTYYTGTYMSVTNLYQDAGKQIWVAFWGGGLKKFDPETGQYTNAYDATSAVTWITGWEDENKKKWLCFIRSGNELILMDPATQKTKSYSYDFFNAESLKGAAVNFCYRDYENRLWICTNFGINIVDRHLQYITNHYLYYAVNRNSPWAYGMPKVLLSTTGKYLVAPWYGKGIYEYDKNWRLKKHIKCIPPQSTSPNSMEINYMEQDEAGNTWYGTDSGLVKQSGYRYQCYVPADYHPEIENDLGVRNMIRRNDGLYWVRFYYRGIYLFDPGKGKFYKNYQSQFAGNPGTMKMDKTGKLWVATMHGFYRYDQNLDSFIQFSIKYPDKAAQQKYNEIIQLLFDKNNNCWFGTNNGLVKYIPAENKFEFITNSSRPEFNLIDRIIEDTTGTIWMKSTAGISAYYQNEKKIRFFSTENGLPATNESAAIFSLADDKIMIGSPGMITTFNPYTLITNATVGPVIFTDISIDGRRMIPLQKMGSVKEITVQPGEGKIDIHFAVLNYTDPQQNKLYYLLYNRDKEWIETNDGDISFYGLPPGKYLLHIKGSNNDGVMNETGDQLMIIVRPYWYQSFTFKIFYLLVLAIAVYLIIRWRVRSVKAAASVNQHITETEMAALKAQMSPHFMFNCINSIDAFIHSNDKYNATLYLNKFAKLLRNILDSSRENTVAFTKDTETLKLYIELEELRNRKKFKTTTNIANELLESDYKVPPLIIQPFVENAILHGLKNKDGNDGLLQIEIKKMADKIEYSIKDNGIGRKAAGQIPQNKESSYGMQLSYDRIRLFNKEEKASVQVIDLFNNGKPEGTLVKVELKII